MEIPPSHASTQRVTPLDPYLTQSPKDEEVSQNSTTSPTSCRKPASPTSLSSAAMMFDPLINSEHKSQESFQTPKRPDSMMIDPFTQSGTLHSDEENAFSGFFDDLKIQSIPQLFTVQAPIDADEEEDHLATLGTKVEESTGKKKNHKRWNSYDHSALKPPNLLSKMKGSTLKMSKSQPATPKQNIRKAHSLVAAPATHFITDLSDLSKSMTTQSTISTQPISTSSMIPPPTIINAPPMQRMQQKDLLNPIFNIAPSPSKRVTEADSFLKMSFVKKCSTKLRTSEMEPSPHQIELPTSRDTIMYAKLCSLLERYREVDKNFDFKKLMGMSSLQMSAFLQSGATPLTGNLTSTHIPIVQDFLSCGNDLAVEDFLVSGENVSDRVEILVLRSDSKRQIIAIWRGSDDGQIKPVRNREMRSIQTNELKMKDDLLPSFQQAYHKNSLESRLFLQLEKLMEENPFFDLAITGFSQGAALATICGSRYSSSNEMIMVNCILFGCPKIGGEQWRNDTHSLPNLKIIRVQTEDDGFASTPTDPRFHHVGHTILLCSGSSSLVKSISHSTSDQGKKKDMTALALKFDKPSLSKSTFFKKKKNHANHNIAFYLSSMFQFAQSESSWVNEFVGENVGRGVQGWKNEKRNVV